jgi:hypothetical protein
MLHYNKETKLDHEFHELAESKEFEAKEYKLKDEAHKSKVFGKISAKFE